MSKSIRSSHRSLVASLVAWLRRVVGQSSPAPSTNDDIERPWLRQWDHLPKRTAGPGFRNADYVEAHQRAREVAHTTLGDELWESLQQQGYLDLPSQQIPGMTYRLRVGRRIQVICAPQVRSPWHYDFLCINPTYPLPEEEFFAHLYLYVRDREDIVLAVAAPQPWDQALGRTF